MKKKRSELSRTRESFEKLEDRGQRLQDEGREIVKMARKGTKIVKFLSEELPKYKEMANSYPEVADVISGSSEWLSLAHNKAEQSVQILDAADPLVNEALFFAVSGVTTTDSVGAVFTSAIRYTEMINPRLDFVQKYGLQDYSLVVEPTISSELGQRLEKIDAKLEFRRQGAWDTFNSGTRREYLSQAAHSMRDVLRNLISKYASNEQVKKCTWWLPDTKTKGGVSQQHRIRCMLCGPKGQAIQDGEAALIAKEIARYDQEYKYLSSVAHGSSVADKNAVEAAMRMIEHLMLLLLRRRAESE